MKRLTWWLRIVGVLYLFMFVAAAVVRAPIRAEGPGGILERAAAGDPTASYVVDSWLMIGLYFLAIGLSLLIASRAPARALPLVPMVVLLEIAGMSIDVYKLANGYPRTPPVVWLVIHATVVVTGLRAARAASPPR
jgi:hypothetical protein